MRRKHVSKKNESNVLQEGLFDENHRRQSPRFFNIS